jgi:16S rRNA (cytosine1402-N4)-methyltransferase
MNARGAWGRCVGGPAAGRWGAWGRSGGGPAAGRTAHHRCAPTLTLRLWWGGGVNRDRGPGAWSMAAASGRPSAAKPQQAGTGQPPSPPGPHVPVMLERCLDNLAIRPDTWFVDATFGAGGHTRALLARGARVLAIDQDPRAAEHVAALRRDLRTAGVADPEERFRFRAGNFRQLVEHVADAGLTDVRGVLLDLGVSSMQLDEGDRGFAFRHDGPLDMRMSAEGPSAADLLREVSVEQLAAWLHRYGEERHSRRLARAIVEARDEAPIATTGRLVEVVQAAYPPGPRRDHPARRTFQALRLVVNDELGALEEAVAAAIGVLSPGGRLVVLAYHSLEDRIVKHALRDRRDVRALHKRPLEPTEGEIQANPRARSAKLRAAEKIGPEAEPAEAPTSGRSTPDDPSSEERP